MGNMSTLPIHVPLFKTAYAKTILDLESTLQKLPMPKLYWTKNLGYVMVQTMLVSKNSE